MIKMTLEELVNARAELAQLLETKMAPKVAYRLAKIGNVFARVLKDYDLHRNELIKKHGKEMPEGSGTFMIQDPAEAAKFNDTILAYIAGKDANVTADPISLKDLGDSQLTPKMLMSLEKIILPE